MGGMKTLTLKNENTNEMWSYDINPYDLIITSNVEMGSVTQDNVLIDNSENVYEVYQRALNGESSRVLYRGLINFDTGRPYTMNREITDIDVITSNDGAIGYLRLTLPPILTGAYFNGVVVIEINIDLSTHDVMNIHVYKWNGYLQSY